MMHKKRHWSHKSFKMPQANKSIKSLHTALSYIREKRFLKLLEAYLHHAVLEIFVVSIKLLLTSGVRQLAFGQK